MALFFTPTASDNIAGWSVSQIWRLCPHIEPWAKWLKFFKMMSLKFVFKGPVDNKSTLIQVMAWCQMGNKPLPEPVLRWLMQYCVTWPLWIKLFSCFSPLLLTMTMSLEHLGKYGESINYDSRWYHSFTFWNVLKECKYMFAFFYIIYTHCMF